MGGLVKLLPFTYSVLVVGSLALMGFPFLAGYYSKDMILEITLGSFVLIGYFFYWILGIATFMTALYSVRLLYRVFLDTPNGFISDYKNIHEAGLWIAGPLAVLAWGSIFLGYLFHEIFSGVGTLFFGQSIFVLPGHLTLLDVEFLPWYIKLLPLILSVGGGFLVGFLYWGWSAQLYAYKLCYTNIYTFFLEKWYFDALQNKLIAKPFLNLGLWFTFIAIDKGFLELCGPAGVVRSVENLGGKIIDQHTGSILHYFRWMLFGIPVLLFLAVM
jgi:NADH:ubiquinone oxidoreductase subunit 5 (subunit L)/multisubunit Na+/H+ antiporter MnhA subunit